MNIEQVEAGTSIGLPGHRVSPNKLLKVKISRMVVIFFPDITGPFVPHLVTSDGRI